MFIQKRKPMEYLGKWQSKTHIEMEIMNSDLRLTPGCIVDVLEERGYQVLIRESKKSSSYWFDKSFLDQFERVLDTKQQ